MNLHQKHDQLVKDMTAVLDAARTEGRELTDDEQATFKSLEAEAKSVSDLIQKARKSADLIDRLTNFTVAGDDYEAAGTSLRSKMAIAHSPWAKSVTDKLSRTAAGMGVKALLAGQVTVPPAAEVSALPGVPTRLLDLIQRVPLDANTYTYLRQVVRDENAAVVPDGADKPTSIYTFQEVEDRARVIAHLSEPFPLRYLSDYTAMAAVLDQEMREGVLRELETQLVSGDGMGESFTGILTTSGVTQTAFATDLLTTIRTARLQLEAEGETPNAWVMNPADTASLELMRENGTSGGFLFAGGTFDVLFGAGVNRVSSNAVPAGTAILADWTTVRIGVRESEHTLAATQAGDLFKKNQAQLRSEGRYSVQLMRPQAVAVVDLAA